MPKSDNRQKKYKRTYWPDRPNSHPQEQALGYARPFQVNRILSSSGGRWHQ